MKDFGREYFEGASPHRCQTPLLIPSQYSLLEMDTMIWGGFSHLPKFPSGDDHFPTQTHNLATLVFSTELGRGKKI